MNRFVIVAPIAAIITVALFFLMRDLIAASPENPEFAETPKIELGRKINDSDPPEPPVLDPPDVKEPDKKPAKPDHDSVKTDMDRPTPIRGPQRPDFGPGGGGSGIGPMSTVDGPASPIIRPKPNYPSCGNGTGQVVLEYTVEPDGSVRDVRVVSATSSCFAKAAERATTSWRYRPEVKDGQPVRSGRMRVTLVFEPE
jgi:periplasmic protein TonB